MRKHIKLASAFCLVLGAIIVLHFVPFDSRSGYLDNPRGNVCIGYLKPVEYDYRWISGGVNTWDDQLSHLRKGNLNPASVACAQPAHLRLYLF